MAEVETLAREAAPEAIRRLIALMDTGEGRIAIAACNAILDRAVGKPTIAVDHSGTIGQDVTQLTDTELMAIVAGDDPKRRH